MTYAVCPGELVAPEPPERPVHQLRAVPRALPTDEPVGSRWAEVWSHRPLLLAMARSRVGWHDAEDIASEAMLRAMSATDVPQRAVRSWLVTTTLRLCTDEYRRAGRDVQRGQRLRGFEPESAPSHEDAVVEVAEAQWLAAQLPRLPERQAQVLDLRTEGHDISMIAGVMELPYKAVESLLSRARRSVRGWAAALITIAGLWRTVARRKAHLHVATATIVVAGNVVEPAARAAGSLLHSAF